MLRPTVALCLFLLCTVLTLPACGSSKNEARLLLPEPISQHRPALEQRDVILSFTPSEEERQITIYRSLPSPANEEYARSIAEKFGITADPTKGYWGACTYSVGDHVSSLIVNSKGEFGYSRLEEPGPINVTLTEEEARRLAETFLSERGLLPKGAQFSAFESSQNPDKKDEMQVVFETPYFTHYSATPIIKVIFDSDGEVGNVTYHWPELKAVGDYPLISEKEAVERFFEGKAYYARLGSDMPLTLLSVRTVFYPLTRSDGAEVFVPRYEFEDPDGQIALVGALPDEYVESVDFDAVPKATACRN